MKRIFYILVLVFVSASLRAAETTDTTSSNSGFDFGKFVDDLWDIATGTGLDMASGRNASQASGNKIMFWWNNELAAYLERFTDSTGIMVGITSHMTGNNQFIGFFDIETPKGTFKEGAKSNYALRLHLHFKQSIDDKRSYQIILTDTLRDTITDEVVSSTGVKRNNWGNFSMYLKETKNETHQRDKFKEEVNKLIFEALSKLVEIPFEVEEEKSVSLIDDGFLFVTVDGRNDTLFDGHSVTLFKDSLVVLRIGYKGDILRARANHSLENETYRRRLIPYRGIWDSKMKLDSTKWKVTAQTNGREFRYSSPTVGSRTLEIDARDALAVVFSDTVGGTRVDTTILANTFKGSKITIKLNVAEGGILRFYPINDEYYHRYGFDDAMITELQRANNTYQKIQISGTDYFVPWLGVQPNTEVEIKMDYTSKNSLLDSMIVLKRSSTNIVFITDTLIDASPSLNVQLKTLRQSTNGRPDTIKAYALLKGNIEIEVGRLVVESRPMRTTEKIVRIVRLKRSNEPAYASFSPEQKQALISDLNAYYRQAFLRFRLDAPGYQDTLTIDRTTTQEIDSIGTQVFSKLYRTRQSRNDVSAIYHIFICSPARNSNTVGRGNLPGKLSIIYNNSSITASHELGHNLGLQHTFEDKYSGEGILPIGDRILPIQQTRNIMDYPRSPDVRRYFFRHQIDHIKTK